MPGAGVSIAPGVAVDISSAVLLTLVGLFVLTRRPRRQVNLGFGAFAALFGSALLFANLGPLGASLVGPWATVAYIGLCGAAGAFLVWVARLFPRPLPARRKRLLWVSIALGFTPYATVLAAAVWAVLGGDAYSKVLLPAQYLVPVLAVMDLAYAAIEFLLCLLAVSAAAQALDERGLRQAALVTAGLVLYYGVLQGRGLAGNAFGNPYEAVSFAVAYVVLGVIAVLWLVASARGPASLRPLCRATAATCFASPVLGIVAWYAFPNLDNTGILGAARLAGVAILAYAILRQQLFDIDYKLKWTLRRGTVVAIIFAAFLGVQEIAQNLVTSAMGLLVGGLATVALALTFAPLQRLVGRLSDRLAPGVRENDPADALRRKEDTYRQAYATAWVDGVLTHKDARLLAEFRAVLGLPAERFAAIEAKWHRENPEALGRPSKAARKATPRRRSPRAAGRRAEPTDAP